MKGQSVLFSKQSNEWETPDKLFNELSNEFYFVLDVCANEDNSKLPLYIGRQQDGLVADWALLCKENCPLIKYHHAWMNPPYSEIRSWVEKAYLEAKNGITVVSLLPARTDTRWFHEFIYKQPHVEIRFIKGRLKFVGAKHYAPFPSMIVIFHADKEVNNENTEP